MENDVMFSVIVPVYNVEKYIEETISSVLEDDYKNLELVLVNDGSKDRSGELCRKVAENDSRVKFIDKENGGVASARNVGISAATGRYLMFLDSDDCYEKGTFEKIANVIKETDCDICQFGFRRFSTEKEFDLPVSRKYLLLREDEVKKVMLMSLTSNHVDADIDGIVHSLLGRTVTDAAVRRDIVKDNDIRFFDFWNNEDDWIFAILCYQNAKKVYLMPDCLYRYREVEGSLNTGRRYIQDAYNRRKKGNVWIMDRMAEMLPPEDKAIEEYRGILQRRLLLTTLYNETAVKSKLGFEESIRYIKRAIKTEKKNGISEYIKYKAGKIEKVYLFFVLQNIVLPVYLLNKICVKKYR